MAKTTDIQLALRWEANGEWQDYSSNFNKKLASSKFRLFCEQSIPGLPVSMNLAKARSFAAHHGGAVIEVSDPNPEYVGLRYTFDDYMSGYEAEEAMRCTARNGERQVAYIIRVPTSSLVYGKLAGHIEGLEISDKAKNRYLYKGQWGTFRVSEEEHERIQTNKSSSYNRVLDKFVRYIPRSTEVGGAA